MKDEISWIKVLNVLPSSEEDYLWNIKGLAEVLCPEEEHNNFLFIKLRKALDMCLIEGYAEAKLVKRTSEESGFRMRRTVIGDEIVKKLESGELVAD